jgi:Protein of unknown function (DUF3106)
MTQRTKFGWTIVTAAGLAVAGGLGAESLRAQSHPDRPPQRQSTQAPAPKSATNAHVNPPNANRPPVNQANRPLNQNGNRPPSSTVGPARTNNFNNRPNGNAPGARMNPRQQVGVGAPRPFVDRMRDLTPQQRDRVLQSSRAFQNLSPEQQGRIKQQFNQWDKMTPVQRADLRAKEDTWRRMTPEQRDHIKNDVLPRWRQMPWERQQVIQQKLGVLQNMPESARNQRLSDPNFTRGMSDEDKATLHDLSHLHVGGAPDPPGSEQ